MLDVGEALQDGYRCVADGKFAEALAIAGAVLKKNPQESGAYALMAMVHEETGDIPEAIRCYEKVVALRPEAKIDAIKLAQLRAMKDPEPAPMPNRKLAFVGAFSAGLIAVAVGMAFAWPRADAQQKDDGTLVAQSSGSGFEVSAAAPPNPEAKPSPNAGTDAQPEKQATSPRAVPEGGTSGRAVLPPANRTPRPLPSTVKKPFEVDITPETLPKPDASGTKPAPPQPAARPDDSNVIERGPGQINISESRRGSAGDSNVSENTYRVAQDKMKAGDYRGAIRDFQAALAGSGKKALIHQLIGRCYTRLGEKAAAKQSFETALALYEAAGAKSAAESVRRELGLLG